MAKAKEKSATKRPQNTAAPQSSNHPSGARFTAAELEHLADRIIRWSDADETEIEIDATVDALTRFANNTIHQNVAEHTLGISVRAVVDGRTARATADPLGALTERERSVLALMAEGLSNAAIAARLFLSDGAISKYTTTIFAKLALADDQDTNRRVRAVLAHLGADGQPD